MTTSRIFTTPARRYFSQWPLRAALLVAFLSTFCATARAETTTETLRFQDLQVIRHGEGRELVFIPGLNSGYDAFAEVCQALQPSVRCHLINLPGFAGVSPLPQVEEGFLARVTDQILSYIQHEALQNPVVVGHSLGGFTALLLAKQQPSLFSGLVIVDSLPYFAAIQNPAATPEQMRPMAEQMKKGMLSVSDQQYQRNLSMQLLGMTRDNERMPQLTDWGLSSDRATTAQAMYELQTMDLRPQLDTIKTPALVVGAWAAYENYGTTKDIAANMFAAQYRLLPNKTIHISDGSYHFIMWDDREWLVDHINSFVDTLSK